MGLAEPSSASTASLHRPRVLAGAGDRQLSNTSAQAGSSSSAAQQSGNFPTTASPGQAGPLQAPAPAILPQGVTARTPKSVVFRTDYLQHTSRPQQLIPSGLFPQAVQGEQGWGFTYRTVPGREGAPENWVWVVVCVGGTTRRGWVPIEKLRIGEFLRSPLPIQYAKAQPALPQLTHRQTDSVLYRTMKGVWQMIKDNKETVLEPLGGEPDGNEDAFGEDTRDLLYGPETGRYVDLMYDSVVPELRNIMDNGTFSPRSFVNPPYGTRVKQVTKDWPGDEWAVIYAMVTEGVTHGLTKCVDPPSTNNMAIYIGQSGRTPDRCIIPGNSHLWWIQNPQSGKTALAEKYQIARTGRKTIWIPVVMIRKSHPALARLGWTKFLHIAELTFVTLLRTWNPLVLRPSTNPHELGSYARDYESAAIFRKFIDEVSRRTGWNPEPTLGMNWTTPIFSQMFWERAWISWYDRDRQSWVFRTRCTLVNTHKKGKKDILYFSFGANNRSMNLPTPVFDMGFLKPGDAIHL